MFHGTKVPPERKFSLWSFRNREQKCRGTKRLGIILNSDGMTGQLMPAKPGASTNGGGGLGEGSPTISKMGGFATKGLH